jgi:hypothetical protein
VIVPHASTEPRPAVGCKVRLSVEPRQIIVTDGTSKFTSGKQQIALDLHSPSQPTHDFLLPTCPLALIARRTSTHQINANPVASVSGRPFE